MCGAQQPGGGFITGTVFPLISAAVQALKPPETGVQPGLQPSKPAQGTRTRSTPFAGMPMATARTGRSGANPLSGNLGTSTLLGQ